MRLDSIMTAGLATSAALTASATSQLGAVGSQEAPSVLDGSMGSRIEHAATGPYAYKPTNNEGEIRRRMSFGGEREGPSRAPGQALLYLQNSCIPKDPTRFMPKDVRKAMTRFLKQPKVIDKIPQDFAPAVVGRAMHYLELAGFDDNHPIPCEAMQLAFHEAYSSVLSDLVPSDFSKTPEKGEPESANQNDSSEVIPAWMLVGIGVGVSSMLQDNNIIRMSMGVTMGGSIASLVNNGREATFTSQVGMGISAVVGCSVGTTVANLNGVNPQAGCLAGAELGAWASKKITENSVFDNARAALAVALVAVPGIMAYRNRAFLTRQRNEPQILGRILDLTDPFLRDEIDPLPPYQQKEWNKVCDNLDSNINRDDKLSLEQKALAKNVINALRGARDSNQHLQMPTEDSNGATRDMNSGEYFLIGGLLASRLREITPRL